MEKPPAAPMPGTPAAAEPQQGSGKTKWIIAGCCGCLLLVGAIVGILLAVGVFAGVAVVKETEPAANDARQFVKEMAADNIDTAYTHLAKAFQAELSPAQLRGMAESKPEFFHVSDPSFTSRNVTNGTITLKGTCSTPQGQTLYCKFIYVNEGGAPKMLGFNINSSPID